ncbi:flagellar protein FliS [Planctomycetota bacterium]|jgi:flagellar protein FliS|nr:flagellar protein FliS [Planctomycetota bacterium]
MAPKMTAAEAYLNSSVENAPPIKIVRLLYQGAIRFLGQAALEDSRDPRSKFVKLLSDADAIVAELRLSLDAGAGSPDVVGNLESLYLFCEGEIQRAMLDRSAEPIGGAKAVLETLLEAWSKVEVEAARAA